MNVRPFSFGQRVSTSRDSDSLWIRIEDSPHSISYRGAVTAYGDLGDASSALWLFSKFPSESTRTWNVLLGSLAKAAEKDALLVVEPMLSQAARTFQSNSTQLLYPVREIVDLQRYSTLLNAVEFILDGMSCSRLAYAPRPDSQSFCIAASALQYSPKTGEGLAIGLFRNATQLGVLADGRFVNAMLRCYGIEIDAALAAWRDEIRPQCMAFDKRQMRSSSKGGGGGRFMENNKNMVASYNGLLYVCGRSLRPDIALRILYAMKRDGLEPNEASLNSYKSGRRRRMAKQTGGVVENETNGFRSNLEQKLYESLLFVECTKYDLNDKRRSGEKRVRIIL